MLKLGWAYNMLKDDRDSVALVRLGSAQSGPGHRGGGFASLPQSGSVAGASPHHVLGLPDLFLALGAIVRVRASEDRSSTEATCRSCTRTFQCGSWAMCAEK